MDEKAQAVIVEGSEASQEREVSGWDVLGRSDAVGPKCGAAAVSKPSPYSGARVGLEKKIFVVAGKCNDLFGVGVTLGTGETVNLDDGERMVTAKSESDVVLFAADPAAGVYKGGHV